MMMMKKKFTDGLTVGIPLGIATVHILSLLLSLILGNGNYYPVAPELADELGSELAAVLVQNLCAVLYGVFITLGVVGMQMEKWSYLFRSVWYIAINVLVLMLLSYYLYLRWKPHALRGLICSAGFYLIFLIIYRIIDYCTLRRNIQMMNDQLDDYQQEEREM